jgi:protease-4
MTDEQKKDEIESAEQTGAEKTVENGENASDAGAEEVKFAEEMEKKTVTVDEPENRVSSSEEIGMESKDVPASENSMKSSFPEKAASEQPAEEAVEVVFAEDASVGKEEATEPEWMHSRNSSDAGSGTFSGGVRSLDVENDDDTKKGRLGSSLILGLLFVSLCLGFALALKKPSSSMIMVEDSGEGGSNPLEGIFSHMGGGKDGVAIVNISGAIQTSSDSNVFSQQKGADRIVEQLKKLGENKNVKAVVLRINSPGGTVGACQEISSEIKRLKEKGIKIVASLADVAASGGVYIAVQADEILANPGTVTGSVGVVFSVMTLPSLLEKLGVKVETVTSGKYKDIGSYARNMRDDERALLQEIVNKTQEQFLNTVAEGRKKDPEEVRKWADGRIFNGEQAISYGLVDELGSLQDAVEKAWKLAGMEGPPHILKEKADPFEQFSEMLGMSLRSLWPVNLHGELNTHAPLLFYYPGGGCL